MSHSSIRRLSVVFVLSVALSAFAADDWHSGTYQYDPSGNIKSIGADAYSYDAVGRLTYATLGAYDKSQSYRYDSFGNLLELGGKPLDVSDTNNRLKAWSYDVVGNVFYDPTVEDRPRTYHYDALGMVTAIDDVADDRRMIYTADDERLVISVGPNTSYRVRDFSNRVLREWRISSGMLVWDRDYVYAENQLVAGHVQVDSRVNPVRHYHTDHLGSIRMVSDGTGQTIMRHDYWPFGEEESSTTQEYQNTGHIRDPLKFTSHERDYFSFANVESDDYVDYMHARYYASGVGRFLEVDPKLNLKRALRQPQNWNRYAYVMNNPLKYTDPTGEDVSIRLNFKDGHWSEAERKKIIAQVAEWYKARNVGKVYVFDGSKASHGANIFKRFLNSGYATLAVSGRTGVSRPHIVYTGQYKDLPPQQRLNAISNSIAHETAAHQFHGTHEERGDTLVYARQGWAGQEGARDPEISRRYGTVADSYMYDDVRTRPNVLNGPIPIDPADAAQLRREVGPHVRVKPPDYDDQ